MKKLAIVAVVVVAAAALWWLLRDGGGAAPLAPGPAFGPPPAEMAGASLDAGDLPPEAELERAAIADEAMAPPPPEVALEPGSGRLTGTVVWEEDREPAAGITVRCGAVPEVPGATVTTVTDKAGHFHFTELRPGHYRLSADRGGDASALVRAGVTAKAHIAIPRGCAVTGVVLSADRRPLPGAVIWLSERYRPETGAMVATTDNAGRFVVRSAQTERYVGARAAGYRPSRLYYLQAEPGETVELELVVTRGDARVRGRAFDSDGGAVENAAVRVTPPGRSPYVANASGITTRGWAAAWTRTDESGAFELEGLPPGVLVVQVRAPGHGVHRSELGVPAGATGHVTATLPAPARVGGRVTNTEGAAVDRAMVQTGAWDDFARTRTWTDETGAFVLDQVTPGDVTLFVITQNQVALRERVTISPGQTLSWNPVLGAKLSIEGRVTDAARRPLVGWRVHARRGEKHAGFAETDNDGQFAIANLEPEPHNLRVAAETKGEGRLHRADVTAVLLEAVVPGSGPQLIEVPDDAMPTCSVGGRVRGPDGDVVGQARISIGSTEGKGNVSVKVNRETGAFEVRQLMPGPYWITVRADGYPEIRVGRRELSPHQQLDLGDLKFEAGGAVTITLRGLDAATLAKARFSILDSNREVTGIVARDGAALRTSRLRPGSYRLVVHGPGIARAAVPFAIEAGRTGALAVDLTRGATRHLRATLPLGTPVPRWAWYTVFAGNEQLAGDGLQAQQDGSYAATLSLGPGSYRVWIGTDGGYSGRCVLEIDAGLSPAPPVTVHLEKK